MIQIVAVNSIRFELMFIKWNEFTKNICSISYSQGSLQPRNVMNMGAVYSSEKQSIVENLNHSTDDQ